MKELSEYKNYRDALIAAIADLAREHQDIVFLDADVSSCIGSTAFQKEFPDRFFNVGIAEANMAAMAGGMASAGLTPFIHSFGVFASRRMYDQLFLSVGYTLQTVHVIGSDPGIVAQYNGGTHMPFEDIALMRQIPDMVVYEPSDARSLCSLVKQVYDNGVLSYLRTPRKGISFRYPESVEIRLGKKAALTLKPATPAEAAFPYLDKLDMVLVMTVEPGFGGQQFMADMLPKITDVAKMTAGKNITVEVDGGINAETAKLCVEQGANVFVAGSAVFKNANPAEVIRQLHSLGEK